MLQSFIPEALNQTFTVNEAFLFFKYFLTVH